MPLHEQVGTDAIHGEAADGRNPVIDFLTRKQVRRGEQIDKVYDLYEDAYRAYGDGRFAKATNALRKFRDYLNSIDLPKKRPEEPELKKISMKQTCRGFVYGEFRDCHGEKCSIQESSAVEPCLWLGLDKPKICVMSIYAKSLPPPKVYPDEGSTENTGWHIYEPPEAVHAFSRMHIDQETAKELVKMLEYFIAYGVLPRPASEEGGQT